MSTATSIVTPQRCRTCTRQVVHVHGNWQHVLIDSDDTPNHRAAPKNDPPVRAAGPHFTPLPYFVIQHLNGWTIQNQEGGAGECVAQQYGDSSLETAYLLTLAANHYHDLAHAVERLLAAEQGYNHEQCVCNECVDARNEARYVLARIRQAQAAND